MSTLIDDLFSTQTKIGHRWFVSKPPVCPLIRRIKDAFRVITGRYEAVKFAEVEYKKDSEWVKTTSFVSPLDLEKAKEGAAREMMKQLFKGHIDEDSNLKARRNEPCPCKSGMKFKYCHGKGKK